MVVPAAHLDLDSVRLAVPAFLAVLRPGLRVAGLCILRGVRPRVDLPAPVREWVVGQALVPVLALVPVREVVRELVA